MKPGVPLGGMWTAEEEGVAAWPHCTGAQGDPGPLHGVPGTVVSARGRGRRALGGLAGLASGRAGGPRQSGGFAHLLELPACRVMQERGWGRQRPVPL